MFPSLIRVAHEHTHAVTVEIGPHLFAVLFGASLSLAVALLLGLAIRKAR